jgi:signal transduction histidine kinase/ligand-binding sensor domain-containing protein
MTRPPLLALALLTTALGLWAHRLPIQVYTTAQGLPRNSVACLVPDRNGLLWVCSSEGLARFDGSEFRTFGRDQGLPSSLVLDFLVSAKGGYWVVTHAGVCRLPPGSKIGNPCRLLEMDRQEGEFQTDSMVESPDGRIWVATNVALYRSSADSRKLERTTFPASASEIDELGLTPDGQLLVTTARGVYISDSDGYRNLSGPAMSDCGFGQVQMTDAGEIWVVGSCGVYRISGWQAGQTPRMDRLIPPDTNSVGQILIRHDHSIWVAAPPGLRHYQVQPGGSLLELERFSTAEGLPYRWITHLTEDSQGNLWGATEGLGIFRILATGFRVFDSEDGLGSGRVSSIFEGVNGDLCVTTSLELGLAPESHLRVKNGDHFERVDFARDAHFHDWGWGWNQIALQARSGEWWFQSDRGLYRYPQTKTPSELRGLAPKAFYDVGSPLGESAIFRVFEDSRGDLWIGAQSPDRTLIRWQRSTGQFRHWTPAEGWPADTGALAIRESAGGAVWIGTDSNLLRFRDGKFDKYTMASGPVLVVRDMYFDRAGSLWVASARNGVYRCDNPDAPTPVFRNYGAHDGLSSESTRSITEDDRGLIYVGTVRAVDRIDPRAPIGGANILHFTAADGLPEADQNVAYRDRRGHLWFGTLKGLAEYDPTQATERSIPRVYIRRVRVRGEDVPLPWEGTQSFSIELPSDKNQVEIEYAGIDLRSVASVRYQYRLSGVDADWSVPSPRFSVNYANMPAGERVFEVRAVGFDGVVGNGFATVRMALQAPLWRRAWFLALASLVLVSTGYWLYSYRVGYLLAMERLRTRIATDLHDDIGASLTQISVLTEIGGRDPSRGVLGEVAVISRDMVDEMSDIVWAVSPRHDRFDSIVHRMRRFAEDAMADGELVFDASGLSPDLPLPLELRRSLYLVFKEAVNNVARHSDATRMVVRIATQDGLIELFVEDNGRGFDTNVRSQGEGLASIRRRLKEVHGTATWDTAPGSGTRFQAKLPLRSEGGGIFRWLRRPI